ncbi:MAG TPA: hypothetical protein VNJ02_17440 [Vicinamibacterales bacterium]|nr:hypothetical protein [Vicinamibacterales bacterium]
MITIEQLKTGVPGLDTLTHREYLVDCADGRGNGHEQLHARKPTVQ